MLTSDVSCPCSRLKFPTLGGIQRFCAPASPILRKAFTKIVSFGEISQSSFRVSDFYTRSVGVRMDRQQQPERAAVVAIECVAGSSRAEEWSGDMLQTGDVVEEIKIGGSSAVRSPFKGGKNEVQKLLHSAFRRGNTSIDVRVRRQGGEVAELQACIVPHGQAGRRQYVLRSIRDPNYAVGFVNRTESECIALQGTYLFCPSLHS